MTTTTTEAIRGQQADGAMDRAALDPTPSAAGLVLTTGDATPGRAEVAPEHDWPASLFIFLANLSAYGLGMGAAFFATALVLTLLGTETFPPWFAALGIVGMGLGSYVQRTLADHVSHFSRWGWWGAMVQLAAVLLTQVAALVTDPSSIVGTGIGIVIILLWLQYFWAQRRDFDIDLDL